jgi:hypothetical protein
MIRADNTSMPGIVIRSAGRRYSAGRHPSIAPDQRRHLGSLASTLAGATPNTTVRRALRRSGHDDPELRGRRALSQGHVKIVREADVALFHGENSVHQFPNPRNSSVQFGWVPSAAAAAGTPFAEGRSR